MARKQSHRKGASFERSVCTVLSRWWTGGKSDACFWRTHSSGARATIHYKKGKTLHSQVGDVCAVDATGAEFCQVFTVSLKRGYQTVTLQDILDKPEGGRTPQLLLWVRECMEQKRQAGTTAWLLIFKRNHRKIIAFFPNCLRTKLGQRTRKRLSRVRPSVKVRVPLGEGQEMASLTGMPLDQFLSSVMPEDIRQLVASGP